MKHLIKKFGLHSIEEEVLKHNWVLPTMAEVKAESGLEYDVVWVKDLPPLEEDHATHGCLYNIPMDKLEVCNKNHMHHIVVIKGNQNG